MSADLRGFRDPLDLHRRRLQWRVDAAMGDVARCVSAVADARDDVETLAQEVAAAAAPARHRPSSSVDPGVAAHLLSFLVDLQKRQRDARATLSARENALDIARAHLGGVQREIDALDRHRAERMAEHLQDVSRARTREADQDWGARVDWHHRVLRWRTS